jgi:rhamnosyltransferase
MISVVIPVRDGGDDLESCLAGIVRQSLDEEVEIVVVDSGSTDGSRAVAAGAGARVEAIPSTAFTHGRARNLGARLARGEILVFTSQDATPADERWLERLVAPLRRDERVAGVYGRQLPRPDAAPPERYFLDFLYGPEPRRQRAATPAEISLRTTLFSNANSALRRTLWERFPFADDVIMSEDQEWSRRVLLAGYEVVYEPRAAVWHSHRYTLRSAFRRFFDSGVSSGRAYLAGGASTPELRRAAREYALGELRWLCRSRQARWIPYAAVYELAKFAALQLGARHAALPLALNRRLSATPAYWDGRSR